MPIIINGNVSLFGIIPVVISVYEAYIQAISAIITQIRVIFINIKNHQKKEYYLLSKVACMNETKIGCARSGLDLNSGWNWQPKNHG